MNARLFGVGCAIFLLLFLSQVRSQDEPTRTYWVGAEGAVLAHDVTFHAKYMECQAFLDKDGIDRLRNSGAIHFIPMGVSVQVIKDHGGLMRVRTKYLEGVVLTREIKMTLTRPADPPFPPATQKGE